MPGLRVIEPLGYLEFLNLMANARLALTDSGGIQEETTILGVPPRRRPSGSRSGKITAETQRTPRKISANSASLV